MSRFKDALEDADIIGYISFQEPIKNEPKAVKEKIINWVKGLI